MSNRHSPPDIPSYLKGGEGAFGGIRDGGRRGRRRAMYEFLTRHRDGRGITPGTHADRFYQECLAAARRLSRGDKD